MNAKVNPYDSIAALNHAIRHDPVSDDLIDTIEGHLADLREMYKRDRHAFSERDIDHLRNVTMLQRGLIRLEGHRSRRYLIAKEYRYIATSIHSEVNELSLLEDETFAEIKVQLTELVSDVRNAISDAT
ncbi:MAG TPA: hypothetical protein DEA75_14790 [Rhodobacteraceae bacterium]|nr:hypothetical protein [Opitutae bacterium]HBS39649.1 hypothetical protein [Paracoccaceae bacterium]